MGRYKGQTSKNSKELRYPKQLIIHLSKEDYDKVMEFKEVYNIESNSAIGRFMIKRFINNGDYRRNRNEKTKN